MGFVAVASLVVGAASYVSSEQARRDAKEAQGRARDEQNKIQGETRAQNAAQAAAERRSQIREERVRRGRIMQSAENTGAAGSSGEFGALGALGTNLASNIGQNLGRIGSADRTSIFAQNAANFTGQAQDASMRAREADQLFNLSTSIFSSAGGTNSVSNAFTSSPSTQ